MSSSFAACGGTSSPVQIVEKRGPLQLIVHPRPGYTLLEAQYVADWLNGRDRPLATMLEDWRDPLLNMSGNLSRLP